MSDPNPKSELFELVADMVRKDVDAIQGRYAQRVLETFKDSLNVRLLLLAGTNGYYPSPDNDFRLAEAKLLKRMLADAERIVRMEVPDE